MNNKKLTRESTEALVLGAILTALVVILQMLGQFIRFGTFQVSLVLIPIVLGASRCGVKIGAWLGFVFGLVVLLNGDAAAFLAIDVAGTIITVLAKGILCGLAAGIAYKALEKYNTLLAVMAAAFVCPVVNTGVFLIGCVVFFLDTISSWAAGGSVWQYMLLTLVGGNFLFELGTNIVLSPALVRVLSIKRKNK